MKVFISAVNERWYFRADLLYQMLHVESTEKSGRILNIPCCFFGKLRGQRESLQVNIPYSMIADATGHSSPRYPGMMR